MVWELGGGGRRFDHQCVLMSCHWLSMREGGRGGGWILCAVEEEEEEHFCTFLKEKTVGAYFSNRTILFEMKALGFLINPLTIN